MSPGAKGGRGKAAKIMTMGPTVTGLGRCSEGGGARGGGGGKQKVKSSCM